MRGMWTRVLVGKCGKREADGISGCDAAAIESSFMSVHHILCSRRVQQWFIFASSTQPMTRWKVTFQNCADASALQQKLQSCKFYDRCGEPKEVRASDDTVIMIVPSEGKTRDSMTKHCVQTFKSYGVWKKYVLEEVTSANESAASSSGIFMV